MSNVETRPHLLMQIPINGYIVYSSGNWEKALEETEKMASKIVKREINALRRKSVNYYYVLKAVSAGAQTFSRIRDFVEARFGYITDQTLSNSLSSLQRMSFLEAHYEKGRKIYTIPDPMVERVIRS